MGETLVLGNYDVVETGEESADNRLHIGTDRERSNEGQQAVWRR